MTEAPKGQNPFMYCPTCEPVGVKAVAIASDSWRELNLRPKILGENGYSNVTLPSGYGNVVLRTDKPLNLHSFWLWMQGGAAHSNRIWRRAHPLLHTHTRAQRWQAC